MKYLLATLIIFWPGVTDLRAQIPIESCDQIEKRIQHYNDLRRKGGSAQQMEEWRKLRDDLRRKYKQLECNKERK